MRRAHEYKYELCCYYVPLPSAVPTLPLVQVTLQIRPALYIFVTPGDQSGFRSLQSGSLTRRPTVSARRSRLYTRSIVRTLVPHGIVPPPGILFLRPEHPSERTLQLSSLKTKAYCWFGCFANTSRTTTSHELPRSDEHIPTPPVIETRWV
jgi:hypothetical protein